MKTAMIYDQCFEKPISYYVLEGDLMHLNDTYANSSQANPEHETQLLQLMYGLALSGNLREPNTREEFVQAIRDGAPMIVCGFLP